MTAALIVFILGIILVGLGLYLLKTQSSSTLRAVFAVVLVLGGGLGIWAGVIRYSVVGARGGFAATWDQTVKSEELILALTPELRGLVQSILNLQLPDHRSYELFEPAVRVVDVTEPHADEVQDLERVAVSKHKFLGVERQRTSSSQDLRMWRPLLDQIDYFKHATFYFVRGHFTDRDNREYASDIGFAGLALLKSGQWASIKGTQVITWRNNSAPGEDDEDWRIRDWQTEKIEMLVSDRLLFEEVLDIVVTDPKVRNRVRTSIHDQLLTQSVFDEDFEPPHKHFAGPAGARHPGLAIVDLDRDGFDDLYVMRRWGKNMLFRNRGDGTLDEVAEEFGLDIEDHSSSAIFADFDNDGDVDLFLGRTMARSMYLVNEESRFVDRSEELVEGDLPFLVSSVSAVDYNSDGLLDVYISTYMARVRLLSERAGTFPIEEFLPEEDARRLNSEVLSDEYDRIRGRPGPPNRLIKNVGDGRFEVVSGSALEVFRNTFQSTWSDFDADGDADVYLANDFAPNNLFRNDGGGTFVDVTTETATADVGFGMGASWGDYDNNGTQDLYVSNMFSKAGLRIVEQTSTKTGLSKFARGNSLLQNDGQRFRHVSGLEKPALLVEKAGWSWGGQFVDIDNDSHLDVYALSGFYTPPKAIRSDVDL